MAATNTCRVPACTATQFVDVIRAEVRERVGLEVGPPEFDGIEFWGIRRKKNKVKSRVGANRGTIDDGLVCSESVGSWQTILGAEPERDLVLP